MAGRTQALPPGAGVSASFPSGSGAWGATWKHTEDTGSLGAPRVPRRLAVPDRPHLGPHDRGPQTPACFCWALCWPMGVPVPSLPLCCPQPVLGLVLWGGHLPPRTAPWLVSSLLSVTVSPYRGPVSGAVNGRITGPRFALWDCAHWGEPGRP